MKGCAKMFLCYIDGKFVKPEDAKLPISDLIIQRGVGVFEALASHNLKPLMLTPPDVEFMKNIVREGIKKIGHDVRVRTFLTGGDNFDSEKNCFTEPRFFAIFDEANFLTPEDFERGVILEPVPLGRDDPSVKSVDYRSKR